MGVGLERTWNVLYGIARSLRINPDPTVAGPLGVAAETATYLAGLSHALYTIGRIMNMLAARERKLLLEKGTRAMRFRNLMANAEYDPNLQAVRNIPARLRAKVDHMLADVDARIESLESDMIELTAMRDYLKMLIKGVEFAKEVARQHVDLLPDRRMEARGEGQGWDAVA